MTSTDGASSQRLTPNAQRPQFGVSYRSRWRADILAQPPGLDCLEVIAENYLDAPPERLAELDALRERYPVLPHGVGLSFGSDAPLDPKRLRKTAILVERVQAPWFSEHLAFTEGGGLQIGHLAPVPFTREALAVVARNVRQWQSVVGVPLLLENITYGVQIPGDLTEAQFITELLDRTGCGLLLDLHNVHTNAVNLGFEAEAFLRDLPLERVCVIHLGGGFDEADGYRVDSHSAATPEPVWELLRWIRSRATPAAVIVEWDVDLPPFDVILRDVETARSILDEGKYGAAAPTSRSGAPLPG